MKTICGIQRLRKTCQILNELSKRKEAILLTDCDLVNLKKQKHNAIPNQPVYTCADSRRQRMPQLYGTIQWFCASHTAQKDAEQSTYFADSCPQPTLKSTLMDFDIGCDRCNIGSSMNPAVSNRQQCSWLLDASFKILIWQGFRRRLLLKVQGKAKRTTYKGQGF